MISFIGQQNEEVEYARNQNVGISVNIYIFKNMIRYLNVQSKKLIKNIYEGCLITIYTLFYSLIQIKY